MKAFLFPLNRVSYQASLKKPLNIFEPRYVQMVHRAEKEGIPIALCYANLKEAQDSIEIDHETYHSVRKITGVGKVEILQKSKDGSMLVMLNPLCKAQITAVYEDDNPYTSVTVDPIQEFLTVFPDRMIALKQLEVVFRNWAKTFFKNEDEYESLIRAIQDPIILVGSIVEFVITAPDLKQSILELDDINEKIDILMEWID